MPRRVTSMADLGRVDGQGLEYYSTWRLAMDCTMAFKIFRKHTSWSFLQPFPLESSLSSNHFGGTGCRKRLLRGSQIERFGTIMATFPNRRGELTQWQA